MTSHFDMFSYIFHFKYNFDATFLTELLLDAVMTMFD